MPIVNESARNIDTHPAPGRVDCNIELHCHDLDTDKIPFLEKYRVTVDKGNETIVKDLIKEIVSFLDNPSTTSYVNVKALMNQFVWEH